MGERHVFLVYLGFDVQVLAAQSSRPESIFASSALRTPAGKFVKNFSPISRSIWCVFTFKLKYLHIPNEGGRQKRGKKQRL